MRATPGKQRDAGGVDLGRLVVADEEPVLAADERVRDSFMPGSGVLSLEVMQKMRAVKLCEAAGSGDVDGNGLDELGPADDTFRQSGTCVPFVQSAASKPRP